MLGHTCLICWLVLLVLFLYRIKDIQKKEKTKPRPQALNTVEMLRVASSGLGTAGVLSVKQKE